MTAPIDLKNVDLSKDANFEFDKLVEAVDMLLQEIGNRIAVFQRFTCDKCNQRLTMREPDTFDESCECELCHHHTNVKEKGCGLLIVGGPDKQSVMEWVAEQQGYGPSTKGPAN